MKKFWRKRSFTFCSIILIAIIGIALTQITLQNDTFYTVKVGEHIAHYGVDGVDPFSFHDLAYTYPHWLYDYLTYLVYSIGGWGGIYITTCTLATILGITIFLVCHKLCHNRLSALAISILTLFLMADFLAARAQLVSYILLILAVYFIERYLASRKIRYIIGLVIIPLLLANLHVAIYPFYFVLFLPYIGEFVVAKTIAKSRGEKPKETITYSVLSNKLEITYNPTVKWLFVIMAAGLLVGLATPLGFTPYTYLYKTMLGNTTTMISEHLPLIIASNLWLFVVAMAFIGILVFSRVKIKLSDLLMICGLTVLAITSRRQVAILALIGSITLSRTLKQLITSTGLSSSRVCRKLVKPMAIVDIVLIAVIIAVSVNTMSSGKLETKMISDSIYPVAAVEYIKENIDLTQARIFNPYNVGSYLLYQDIPVFIDSRADLYAPEFSGRDEDIFTDAANVESLKGEYYDDILSRYNITHVLTYNGGELDIAISGDGKYGELYRDDEFVIYKR